MAKRAKNRARVVDLVITALISLYLAAVCAAVAPLAPAADLGDALRWGAGSSLPVGVLGAWLGRLWRWAAGPWLLWALPLLPWAWIPFRHAKSRARFGRRALWVTGALLAFAALVSHDQLSRIGVPPRAGGAIGEGLEGVAARLVGSIGSFLLLSGLLSWMALRRLPPLHLDWPWLDRLQGALGGLFGGLRAVGRGLSSFFGGARERFARGVRAWRRERAKERGDAGPRVVEGDDAARAEEAGEEFGAAGSEDEYEDEYDDEEYEYEDEYDEEDEYEDEDDEAAPAAASAPTLPRVHDGEAETEFRLSRDPSELLAEETAKGTKRRRKRGDWPLPTYDLLDEIAKEERGFSREVLQMNARLLMETLGNYGIEGQINEIRPGPVVTTFEFEPAPGVKVSQITSRADDLALAMRATRIRIEAPIPGKAAVGIEIPNPYPQTVGLKQVVAAIGDDDDPLTIAVGKDTEGSPFLADLADMPHLLVAGATGSGKSVCVNAIICNLLLRNGPDRVKLLMIDPKMLELSVYNGIPHLMHPVITEAREALKAVKYMVAEMETRYAKLARHGVRNIKDFNEKIRSGKAVDDRTGEKLREPLPYCVFIIDELADLMMQLGSDLETPIARLAQMARAVGIHLVLATQRPSVNVITGVIKANFPSRIGFRVISKIDSRTILDGAGAEQLLGKGDMLILLAGMAQPKRVHGAFLTIEECERVVEYWRQYAEEENRLELDGPNGEGGVDLGEDELYEEALRLVVLTQTGSTTMLQRRLRVGYTRASRLMDMLEAAGVVGPYEGSKARQVLMAKEELEAEG